jgi:hypothetical protein
VEVGSKRVELAHKLIPAARAIALLVNPANPLTQPVLNDSQAAARALGLQFHILEARNEGDFDEAFKAATDVHADAVIIASADPFVWQSGRTARRVGAASPSTRDLPVPPLRSGRWLGELRRQLPRLVSPSRYLYGPYPEGRETCRLAGSAIDQT